MTYNFDEIIPRQNTSCVKYDLLDHFFGSPDLIPLWVADMDFHTPDFVVNAIKERASHEIYGYSFRTLDYDQAIIGWFKRRHGWEIREEWLAFSPGVVPALNLIVMGFTQPGDEIIVQPPVYFPFFSAVENHGRTLVHNQLMYKNGRYYFDFDDLEKKISVRTKMLMLCNPHNPVGCAWTEEELTKLAEICRNHNILILSDEIHCDLTLSPHKHAVMASLSDDIANQTITTVAPSKTFNLAGMATSAVVCSNPELKQRYDKILDQVHVGMGNLFGAVAAQAAYTHGDEWLNQMLEYVKENCRFVCDFLENYLPQIRPVPLEATYLLWLDCSAAGFGSHDELKDFMIQKAGLALSDGATFGPGGEGFMRMNLACPRSLLEKALLQLREAFNGLG
ncbi:MAG TPA: putative C-S lyase [Bacteroidales bacterium]|nr:putative C-S lyase [Bacteroidales bacterium]